MEALIKIYIFFNYSVCVFVTSKDFKKKIKSLKLASVVGLILDQSVEFTHGVVSSIFFGSQRKVKH